MPYIPSKSIYIKSQQIANKLGIENPLTKVIGEIANIRAQLFQINLDTDEFPFIENPFDTSFVSDVVSAVTNQLPPLPDPTLNTGTQFGNVNTNVSPADQYAALWPGDTLGKLSKQKQTANQLVKR